MLTFSAPPSQDQKLLEFVLPPVARDVQHIHMPYNGTGKAKLEEIQQDLDSVTRKFRTLSVSSPRKKDPAFDIGSPQFHYGANTSRPRTDTSREWLSDTKADDFPLVPPPRSPSRMIGKYDSEAEGARSSLSRTHSLAARPLSPTTRAMSPVSHLPRLPGPLRMRSNRSTTNDNNVQPPPYEQRMGSTPTVDSISRDLDRIELASSPHKLTRASSSAASFNTTALPSKTMSPLTTTVEDPLHQIRMLGQDSPIEPSSSEASNVDHHKLWRATLFKHTAILFDQKCATVEFTKPNEKRYGDFLMEPASGPCQLYLITKGNKSTTGGAMRYSTSIWVLSDDGEVVMEQELPDDSEVIPYTIWDNHTKIVLRVPAELKFFRQTPSDRPKEKATTTWVNYIFADAASMYLRFVIGMYVLTGPFSCHRVPKCIDGKEITCIYTNPKDDPTTPGDLRCVCKSTAAMCSRKPTHPSRPQLRSSLRHDPFRTAILHRQRLHDLRSERYKKSNPRERR